MNHDELIQLNQEIADLEQQLLEQQVILNETKKTFDIAKMTFKNGLDKKEFSNDEKREAAALEEPSIKQAVKDIAEYDKKNKLLDIDIRFKLRLFNIMLKSELM